MMLKGTLLYLAQNKAVHDFVVHNRATRGVSRRFVRIGMEGSAYTEQTVDITLRMHQQFEHVGTVIQSCMHRSKRDIEQLIAQGVRVRLVKGAYKEPREVAFQLKSEVDHNYVRL